MIAGSVVLGGATPITAAAEPAPAAAEAPPAPAEQTAAAEARRTGKQVPVADELTETTAVLANPDGTFTLRSHSRPVRARKDGQWRDVDTSLTRAADGTLETAATSTGLSFSGGGDEPLVTMREGDKLFTLSWPKPLPEPVVDGSSATYPDVMPGVDLKLTANATGYSEVLVVRDAKAAANPELAAVKLRANTTNLTMRTDEHDVLSAVDGTGQVVFQGSTPVMWDSTKDAKRGPDPTPTDPGGGKVSTLDVTTAVVSPDHAAPTEVELTVKPDAEALTGEDVEYPVYIDPVMSRYKEAWAEVTDNGWYYWNAAMDAQVGLCGNWNGCGGSWVARSFFKFNTTELQARNGGVKPVVYSATFNATQTHGTSCTAEPVDVYVTDPISSATRWPGPGGWRTTTKSSNAGDQCGGAANVPFDVIGGINAVVNGNWPDLHLGLISSDEGDRLNWKKFANNPHLDVVFSFPPNVANGLWIADAVTCRNQVVVPTARPTLHATATDNNNPPLNVGLYFQAYNIDGTVLEADTADSPVVVASGTQGRWTTNKALPDGVHNYRVAVKNQFPGDAEKNLWAGPWSDWLRFTTRSAPITQKPVITSDDYPADYWGPAPDQAGKFTFNANGASNVVGFTYMFDGSGTERAPKPDDCNHNQTFGNSGGWIPAGPGPATITVPGTLSPGYHTLHVRSFDDAHRLSPESGAYTFYLPPTLVPAPPQATYEAERLQFSAPSSVHQANYENYLFSGGVYKLLTTTTDNTRFHTSVTAPGDGDYEVVVGTADAGSTMSPLGKLSFSLDGRPLLQVSQDGTPTGPDRTPKRVRLAGLRLTGGTHVLEVQMTRNPASTDAMIRALVDYIQLVPTTRLDAEFLQPQSNYFHVGVPDCCGTTLHGGHLEMGGTGTTHSTTLQILAPVEADYALAAGLIKAPHHGKYTVLLDDVPIANTDTTPIDGYSATRTAHFQPLSGIHMTSGWHRLTFAAVGTNPASTGNRYAFGLDHLSIQPINNVTLASFTHAMNNKAIGSDGTTAAAADFARGSISAQTLAAAGLAPGTTAVIGGAAFAMPAATSGNDNVVAMGQTIPFPAAQQVKASAVGLLAFSTCGTAPSRSGTITYTDGSTSNPAVPELGDWVHLRWEPTGITLPYRLVGTTTQAQYQPVLTPIFLPTDPTKTIKSITLPNYGTSFLCDKPALHVMSMAPRPVEAGWVGAWAAPANAAVVPPGGHGFADKTLRTVLRPTVTGGQVRVKVSNSMSNNPVTIDAATVAAQIGAGAATAATTALKFRGNASVTLPAGAEVHSDPVSLPTGGNGNLVVSIHLPGAVATAPVHGNATAPVHLASGNAVNDTTGAPFTTALNGSYYVAGLDVSTADLGHGTVAVLGDQLSATAPAGSGQRNTWVDELPAKLAGVGATLPGGLVNAGRSGVPDTGRWRMTEGTGTTARDHAGGANATAAGGTAWVADPQKGTVPQFNGTSGHFKTAGRVLHTDRSFSVSAWAKLRSLDVYQTVVSQDGGAYNTFFLQYSAAQRRWMFGVYSADAAQHTTWLAHSDNEPVLNTWYHLTATYDQQSRMMRLYVDGTLQDSISGVTTFATNGPLTIGRARDASQEDNFFNGSIMDVRVHQRVLSPNDVTFAHAQRDFGTYPESGAIGAGSVRTDLYRTALDAPNVRTVLVASGANSLLRGVSATEVRGGLTALISAAHPEGLKRTKRPDGTPVHVILTTIPPLGLAASDPREVQRRQLNQEMLTHFADFGADYVVDFDDAVRDSADPGRVAAQYLTDGLANGAYHSRLAQYLADAVNDFPPRAEL
ncbi:LamG-like jellyroll fold domain-containing protein [Saccharothrix stipae]